MGSLSNKIWHKTFFLLLITCLSFPTPGFSEDFSFRKTKWGMTKEEVKASESTNPIEENDEFLAYDSELLNKNVMVSYFFIDNKLTEALYSLKETHTNNDDYITDYYDFKEILVKKYGESKVREKIWKNRMYEDVSNPGLLISLGHLVYRSYWETDSTQIYLSLHGDNFEIVLGIAYISKGLKALREKKEEKKALESF